MVEVFQPPDRGPADASMSSKAMSQERWMKQMRSSIFDQGPPSSARGQPSQDRRADTQFSPRSASFSEAAQRSPRTHSKPKSVLPGYSALADMLQEDSGACASGFFSSEASRAARRNAGTSPAAPRPPPGGISSLGGGYGGFSPVHDNRRPQSAACVKLAEEIAADRALRSPSVPSTPRGTSVPRKVPTSPRIEVADVPFAWVPGVTEVAPPAKPAPSSDVFEKAPYAYADVLAAYAVQKGAKPDTSGGSTAGPSQDFVRKAAEKLEAWKSFRQRNDQDMNRIMDAARVGGIPATPDLGVSGEAQKGEPLSSIRHFPQHCVTSRRRDYDCPVRMKEGTHLRRHKEEAESSLHPAQPTLPTHDRPRAASAQRPNNGDRMTPRSPRQFQPVMRTPDKISDTASLASQRSFDASNQALESSILSRRALMAGSCTSPRTGRREKPPPKWR